MVVVVVVPHAKSGEWDLRAINKNFFAASRGARKTHPTLRAILPNRRFAVAPHAGLVIGPLSPSSSLLFDAADLTRLTTTSPTRPDTQLLLNRPHIYLLISYQK